MAEAKTYLQEEVNQKEPQKIQSHMVRTEIDKDEKILAIFGKSSALGSLSCLISTDDRLIYFNNVSVGTKKSVVLYTDLTEVLLKSEQKNEYIALVTNGEENIRIDIKAAKEDTEKMFDFINNYKEMGRTLVENKLKTDKDYAWKVEAIQNHKNLKVAAIEQRHANKTAGIEDEKRQIRDNYADKIVDIDKKYQNRHQNNQDKINQIASSRAHYSHRLNYRSGLGADFTASPAKLTMNSLEQVMEIEPDNYQKIGIPFTVIKNSYVTTDTEIPVDDYKNKYDYVLHIQCQQNGRDFDIVFSNKQKQNETVDIIHQLNYAMQHIGEKIEEFNSRSEKYDQRDQQLRAEREKLLAQRTGQIDQMHNLFHPNDEIEAVPDNGATYEPVSTPLSSSPFDEVKKFKELLDQGIITQEEFDAKKKQLLNL